MRRHRFPILLAAAFAAFSLFAGAAPQLDYDVEAPIDEKNKGFEEREVHKNTTAVCSDPCRAAARQKIRSSSPMQAICCIFPSR